MTRTTADGNLSIWAELLPEEGARFLARFQLERDRVFKAAQRSGRRETSNQYSADALMAIVDSVGRDEGRSEASKATVSVVVDHSALVRGHRGPGETCELPGIGEVPVAQVRAMMSDCILRVLVVKGADVVAATSPTRTIPAAVRAALDLRDRRCVVPSCDETFHLERDHYKVPFAAGGASELSNLAKLCTWHHRLKTHHGFKLEGEPGNWKWSAPPDASSG